MKTLSQKPWAYTLYERDGVKILSVVCGGVAVYEVNVRLTPDEAARVEGNDAELDALAESIRSNHAAYKDRQVKI